MMRTPPAPGGWRLPTSLSEGLRNLGVQSWPQITLTTLLLTGLGLLSFAVVAGCLAREEANTRNGAYVWIAAAQDADGRPLPLDASACAKLGGNELVAAAGHVSGTANPMLWTSFDGGPELPSRFVSPGIAAVFASTAVIDAPTAGNELLRLGLVSPGQQLTDTEDQTQTTIGAGRTGELPYSALDSAILIPVPDSGTTEECLIRMERDGYPSGPDLVQAAFPGQRLGITPFRDTSLDLAPIDQYHAFMAVHPGIIAGTLLGLVLLGITFARRAQLMVYRMIGTGRATLSFILTTETAGIVAIGTAIAIPLSGITGALAFGTQFGSAASVAAALHILSAAAVAIASYLLGTGLLVGGNPVAAMRER